MFNAPVSLAASALSISLSLFLLKFRGSQGPERTRIFGSLVSSPAPLSRTLLARLGRARVPQSLLPSGSLHKNYFTSEN